MIRLPAFIRRYPLRTRLMLGVLCTVILALWVGVLAVGHVLRAEMEAAISEQQFSTVAVAAREIDRSLRERLKAVVAISRGVSGSMMHSPQTVQRYLDQRIVAGLLFNWGVMVLDRKGVAIASTLDELERVGVDYGDVSFIQAALSDGQARISDPVRGKLTGQPLFSIVAPIKADNGEVLGLAVGMTNLIQPNFLDEVGSLKYGKTGDFLVTVPKARLFIASSDRRRVMKEGPPPGVNPLYDRYLAGYEGSGVATSSRGVVELSSSTLIPSTGWMMQSVLPADEAFAPVRAMESRLFALALVLSLTAALAGGWWVRRQLGPLEDMAERLAAMRDGIAPRQALPVRRQDEIGSLITVFNSLLATIAEQEAATAETRAYEHLRKIVSQVPGMVFQYRRTADGQASLPFASDAIEDIYSVSPEAVRSNCAPLRDQLHPDDREAFFASIEESAQALTPWQIEYRICPPAGGVRWLSVRALPEPAVDGEIIWHGVVTDITERKAVEAGLHTLAFYDPLTRLPNRRLLLDRLTQTLAACRRDNRHGALLFLDLDNFKTLNDTQGHDIGDLLLIEVAGRLKKIVREDDIVARLGGDEFVVLLQLLSESEQEAEQQVESVAGKILDALSQPYLLDGHEHRSTSSIGIALFQGLLQGQAQTTEELLKHADLAMYQAKAAGRNTYCLFRQDMQVSLAERTQLESELYQAVFENEFALYYQPQVDGDGRCVGVEALIRWPSPTRGMVSPAEFIPLAEAVGLILPIGSWVLQTACQQMVAWQQHPLASQISVAINVSPMQFRLPIFVEELKSMIDNVGANPALIKLEITEGMLVSDVDDAIAKMTALRDFGVRFSLDDFGTGYSSLAYLKRLPLDQVKIDQSFVRDILSDPNDAAICRAVIALGKSLGLKVIAEGVETESQHAYLHREGCDEAQGYYFGRPMPADQFLAWLEGRAAL